MLCGLPGLSIVVISAPVAASATTHFGAPSSGAYSVVPSGESAMRSVPRLFVALFPDELVGEQIVGGDAAAGGHVEPGGAGVRGDALDRFLRRHADGRSVDGGSGSAVGIAHALDELVPVIDVEDQDAGAAVAQVVAAADTRQRRVEEALRLLRLRSGDIDSAVAARTRAARFLIRGTARKYTAFFSAKFPVLRSSVLSSATLTPRTAPRRRAARRRRRAVAAASRRRPARRTPRSRRSAPPDRAAREPGRLHRRRANRGERSRSVAAAEPPYITSRASALTTAICANEPLSASVSATADVKMIGVGRRPVARMDAREERRQLALLRQREQHARAAQHLAGVVAGHRDHRSDADQQRAGRRRGTPPPRRRSACVSRDVGQHALRDDLRSVMTIITDDDRRHQRERHVAPRVERLARRHRHDVVAAVDEDQQQRRRSSDCCSVIGGSVVSRAGST